MRLVAIWHWAFLCFVGCLLVGLIGCPPPPQTGAQINNSRLGKKVVVTDPRPDPQWEEIVNPPKTWKVHRCQIPGGWLVITNDNGLAIVVIHDPKHQWLKMEVEENDKSD